MPVKFVAFDSKSENGTGHARIPIIRGEIARCHYCTRSIVFFLFVVEETDADTHYADQLIWNRDLNI